MKNTLVILLLFFSFSAPVSAAGIIDQLSDASLNGGYQAAITNGQQAIETDPDNAELLLMLGRLETKTGLYDEARSRFQRIIELNDARILSAQFELAELLRLQGQSEQADDLYRRIRSAWQALQRPTVDQMYAIARATHRLGRHDPARFQQSVRFLDEVIRRDPTHLDAAVTLAGVLLEKYNSPEAMELLRDVLDKNSKHAEAVLMLARVNYFEYSTETIVLVEQALELNPDLEAAHVLLAQLQMELEDYEAAHAAVDA